MNEIKINGRIVSATVLFKRADLPDYEIMGLTPDSEKFNPDNYEPCEFRFDIADVSNYNNSDLEGAITLRLKNGDQFSIGHSLEEFDEFIQRNQ